MNRFLWQVKNFVVHRIRFPRRGLFFRIIRRIYKLLWSFEGKRINKKITAARKIFEKNSGIESLIIDRKEGGVFSFPNGKFRWADFKDPESLLGIIILSNKLDYEPKETELFSLLVRPGDIVFDIGANFGWHSIHFAKLVIPKGQVYCFEPVPDAYYQLQENISLNFSNNHIVAKNLAVGGTTGRTTIFVPRRLGSAFATLFPATIDKEFSEFQEIEIDMITLDDFMRGENITRVNFVKIDAEGAEMEIIRGSIDFLNALSPLLYIEINDKANRDIFSALSDIGYSPFYFERAKLRSVRKKSGQLPDFNFLFIKSQHRRRLGYLIET